MEMIGSRKRKGIREEGEGASSAELQESKRGGRNSVDGIDRGSSW